MKRKLQIFKHIAINLSFTKAAEQFFISQPAISKLIRNLEDEYKSQFFVRQRNSLSLTPEGKIFLKYANQILNLYDEMETEFLSTKNSFPENITFGASSTVAAYIVPKIIAEFIAKFPQTSFDIKSGNSEQIEDDILNQNLDFGIIEGKNTNLKLQYKKFKRDEIVLVTNVKNKSIKGDILTLQNLPEIPMIVREIGSGTRNISTDALQKKGINKLNSLVILNSTEAIKNYLKYSNHFAFLSISAVSEELKNNQLKIIDIKDFTLERWFYFVSRTGYQSQLFDYFEKLIRNNYNF
ncbi:DNA-binding transcriptional regulator, LysR family [Halpernia humi]|uniref:DNA-binding transcriptional regulator, LysR family n=1 Tax=Halpernia humi TaxID=493375 RepID=A0A1H6AK56_9FLAO|nr:LysR substrate-binding domain-containing protein [Halpernia humi]SEG48620.1 DNA-binding transcriptional regulator, LysR family [Halpernia humi]